jgi:methyl-accepting chemotaxis protein
MEYFSQLPDTHIVGVADLNDDAPAMARARELGYETSGDIARMIERPDVDLVVEVTGNDRVRQKVLEMLGPRQNVMSGDGAKIMVDIVGLQQERNDRMNRQISSEFSDMNHQLESASVNLDSSLKRVGDILDSTKVLTMNARIEAARAGELGRSFGVITEAMQDMVGDIEAAVKTIKEASQENHRALSNLEEFERRLVQISSHVEKDRQEGVRRHRTRGP